MSFTAGFNGRSRREIRRERVRWKGFDLDLDQAKSWRPKHRRAVGPVHQHSHPEDVAAVLPHDLQRLPDPAALSDDIFHNHDRFVREYFKTAAQYEFALFLFGKNEPAAKLPGHFLANDQAAHGGSDNGARIERTKLFGESSPKLLDDRHFLQSQGALEELAAVQTAAENEVAIEESAGLSEKRQGLSFIHILLNFPRSGPIYGVRKKLQSPSWPKNFVKNC